MNEYQKKYEELVYFRQYIQPINRWNKLSKVIQDYNLPPLYAEYHHIKPKKLYPELAKDPANIVCLTAYEHVLAHKYLMQWYKEEFGENSNHYYKMVTAYDMFYRTNKDHIPTLKLEEIEKLKIEKSKAQSARQIGIKFSAERLNNLRLACKDPERNKKISDAQKGHIAWNRNQKFGKDNKVYASRRGRIKVNNGKIELCVFEDNIPIGFVKGQLPSRRKAGPSGKIHVNNGIIEKFVEPGEIPEGFVIGRLKRIS